MSAESAQSIAVAVRVRPIIEKEQEQNSDLDNEIAWVVEPDGTTISSTKAASAFDKSSKFTFDHAFGPSDTTQNVYDSVARSIVESAMKGVNGTIFAYGQTSSGKTHTMMGDSENPGIIRLAVQDIFAYIEQHPERDFILRASFMEIYNEEIKDLLAPFQAACISNPSAQKVKVKIHDLPEGVMVKGLAEEIIYRKSQLLQLMADGNSQRHVGKTGRNDFSSRSHSIFRISIESQLREESAAAIKDRSMSISVQQQRQIQQQQLFQRNASLAPSNKSMTTAQYLQQTQQPIKLSGTTMVSTLNLVDLAGSERIKDTHAEGERRVEGQHINLSLLTLGTVIQKLSEIHNSKRPGFSAQVHVPFRDSKLTRILQSALGGNSRTAIICAITPSSRYHEETLSTLKFAMNAKRIQCKPVTNEVIDSSTLLKRKNDEITRLQEKIAELEKMHCEKFEVRETQLRQEYQNKIDHLNDIVISASSLAQADPNSSGSFDDGSFGAFSVFGDPAVSRRKKNRRGTWCPGKRGGTLLLDDIRLEVDFNRKDQPSSSSSDLGFSPSSSSSSSSLALSSSSSFFGSSEALVEEDYRESSREFLMSLHDRPVIFQTPPRKKRSYSQRQSPSSSEYQMSVYQEQIDELLCEIQSLKTSQEDDQQVIQNLQSELQSERLSRSQETQYNPQTEALQQQIQFQKQIEADLKNNLTNWIEKYQQLQRDSQQQLQVSRQNFDQQKHEIIQLNQQLQIELETQLISAEQQKDRIATLEKQITIQNGMMKELQDALEDTQRSDEQKRQAGEHTALLIKEKDQEIARLSQETLSQASSIESLQAEVQRVTTELQSVLETHQTLLHSNGSEVVGLRDTISQLESQLESQRSTFDEKVSQIGQLLEDERNKSASLQEDLELEQKKTLSIHQDAAQQLEDERNKSSSLQENLNQLQQLLEQEHNRSLTVQEETRLMIERDFVPRSSLQQINETNATLIEDLKKQKDEAQSALDILEVRCVSIQQEYQQQCHDLQAERDAKKQLETQNQQLLQTQSQTPSVFQHCIRLQEQLDEEKKKVLELSERLSAIPEPLPLSSSSSSSSSSQNNEAEYEQMKAEVNQLRQQLSDAIDVAVELEQEKDRVALQFERSEAEKEQLIERILSLDHTSLSPDQWQLEVYSLLDLFRSPDSSFALKTPLNLRSSSSSSSSFLAKSVPHHRQPRASEFFLSSSSFTAEGKEHDKMKQQIDQQTEKLKQVMREKSTLVQEKAAAERELKTLRKQLQMMQQESDKVNKTHTKVKETQTMAQQLEKKNESLLKSNTKLKSQIAVFEEAQENLQQHLQRAEHEKQMAIQQLESEKALVQDELNRVSKEKDEIETKLTEKCAALESTKVYLQELIACGTQLEEELKRKSLHVQRLEEELPKLCSEFEETFASRENVHILRLKEKTELALRTQQELDEKNNLIAFERQELEKCTKENAELKKRIDQLNQKIQDDQISHNERMKELSANVASLSSVHVGETTKLEEEKQALRDQMKEINKYIDQFQGKLQQITLDHENEKRSWANVVETKDEEIASFSLQIENYKTLYQEAVQSKEAVEKQHQASRQNLLGLVEKEKRERHEEVQRLKEQLENAAVFESSKTDERQRELEISLAQHKQEAQNIALELRLKQDALSQREEELAASKERLNSALSDHQKIVLDLQMQLDRVRDENRRYSEAINAQTNSSSSQMQELESLKRSNNELVQRCKDEIKRANQQCSENLRLAQDQLEKLQDELETSKLENLEVGTRLDASEQKIKELTAAVAEAVQEKAACEAHWAEKRLEYMRLMKEKAIEWKQTKRTLLEKQRELTSDLKKVKLASANVDQQSSQSLDRLIEEKTALESRLEDLQATFLEQSAELNSLKRSLSRSRPPFDPNKENASNLS